MDDDDTEDLSEFREKRRFFCSDGYCGLRDCCRCFPWQKVEDEDDPVIDLLN